MSRGGQEKEQNGPERRCIATGELRDPALMIRFVVGPEGQAVPDVRNKLPGRGIWVSADKGDQDEGVLTFRQGAGERSGGSVRADRQITGAQAG